jgi:hypothetical protein
MGLNIPKRMVSCLIEPFCIAARFMLWLADTVREVLIYPATWPHAVTGNENFQRSVLHGTRQNMKQYCSIEDHSDPSHMVFLPSLYFLLSVGTDHGYARRTCDEHWLKFHPTNRHDLHSTNPRFCSWFERKARNRKLMLSHVVSHQVTVLLNIAAAIML